MSNYPKQRYKGPKPWVDKEWLYNEYIIKDRSSSDIANEYGCMQNTIQCWLLKHGIKKEIMKHNITHDKPYQQYEYLVHHHIELGESMAEMARACGVSSDTIRYNLIRNGIQPHQKQHQTKYSVSDEDMMIHLYRDEHMSAYQIAQVFETDHNTIIRHLSSRGIETRNMQEAQFNANNKEMPKELMDAEWLRAKHWDDRMSCKDIGQMVGVGAGTVRKQMQRLGVPTKNNAQAKIGQLTGDKHPNWKGGITPLNLLLREYFHTNQVPVIAKRDGYTCQLCGASHTILHVHHIVEFAKIVDTICAEHPELNTANIDERMKLYNIIVSDHRFLDEDNLITLCKTCHRKLHGLKSRKIISSQASTEEGSETILEEEYAVSV